MCVYGYIFYKTIEHICNDGNIIQNTFGSRNSKKLHFKHHSHTHTGAIVIKYPRSGKAAKKLFRFSFVEGKIYLTWKGKFGNQGVDLGEVSGVCGVCVCGGCVCVWRAKYILLGRESSGIRG